MAIWLDHVLMPVEPSELRDASTGEPLVFVTDHYRVPDAGALKALLDACPELEADGQDGWVKLSTAEDGTQRAALHVHPGKVASRLEVFYRTEALADEGRPWFEGVAGDSVKHLSRDRTDPLEALRGGLEQDDDR
jgi:hypothetical protein